MNTLINVLGLLSCILFLIILVLAAVKFAWFIFWAPAAFVLFALILITLFLSRRFLNRL